MYSVLFVLIFFLFVVSTFSDIEQLFHSTKTTPFYCQIALILLTAKQVQNNVVVIAAM